MRWAIVHGRGRNYFVQWTGIGPRFGGNKNTAAVFRTKREAEAEIRLFPMLTEVMSRAVKLPPRSKR